MEIKIDLIDEESLSNCDSVRRSRWQPNSFTPDWILAVVALTTALRRLAR